MPLAALAILALCGTSHATSMRISDFFYLTHYNPGETVRFSVNAVNRGGTTIGYAYADIVLTNTATNAEIEIGGSATSAITPGMQITSIANWTAGAPGFYSATLRIIEFDGVNEVIGDSKRGLERINEFIHVGITKDSLAAFPRVLDLGTLQYGRYMHPAPIEISWSFFSHTSQIRKDNPWFMRIYTDNHKRYAGIPGSFANPGAGLISMDGKYSIPLKVWCLNFGPDVEEGWDAAQLGPPPVQEDHYWKGPLLDTNRRDESRVAWEWIPDYADMNTDVSTGVSSSARTRTTLITLPTLTRPAILPLPPLSRSGSRMNYRRARSPENIQPT